MPSHNLINVESRIILGYVSRLHKDIVDKHSQFFHNNPYGVMLPPSPRKTNHEVYIKVLPLLSRNLNTQGKTSRINMLCLNLLIIRTLGYVFCNVLLYTIPPINLIKITIDLGGTWMYGISGHMDLCNNPGTQIIHIWYTKPILILKYFITS
ncbi:hypothetical protein EJD97_014575 [Solanum chilense]|uniref:Uncharacterized protein n=1 Tax=Solanum chilense TaxID=4083 RepID=A0A6N2BB59_SOLCI|nr:hypothetical protein EJD97_014575 [Solanum chilense]